MTLLFLAPEAPVPPLTGGRERTRRVLRYAAARRPVHLLACADEIETPQLQDLAREAGLAGLTIRPYPSQWRGYGAVTRAVTALAQAQAEPFDGVHCVGLDLWRAARAVPLKPGGRRVLEVHDLPRLVQPPPARLPGMRHRRLLRRLAWADDLVVVSDWDQGRLREWGLRGPIHVVPNGVDLAYWAARPTGNGVRTDGGPVLLFPAAFNWPPNADAARVLAEAVLPRVRAIVPDARLVLAGRLPGPRLLALAADPAVSVAANPADMRPLLAHAALVVVPTTAASGTRMKILQALAAGCPVVSTPEGARGLNLAPDRDLAVAPLVDEFAAEIVRLLTDPQARAAQSAAGRAAVQVYAWERVLGALDDVYALPQ